MQTKTVPDYKFIGKSFTTTLENLASAGRPVAEELGNLIKDGKIKATGPMQWNYYGLMDNTPGVEFTMEVGIPVTDDQESIGEFEVKTLPEFKCCVATHNGDYDSLSHTYEALMEEIAEENAKITGINREIYSVIDEQNQANNITEVQLGIE